MRTLFAMLAFLACCTPLYAQSPSVWMETDGYTHFYSKALVEDIEAANLHAASAINTGTNDIAVKIPIAQFQFANSLMQEHFNENYLESDKYPNATFKGKVAGVADWSKPGTYDVTAKGQLTMHGKTRDVTLQGQLTIEAGTLQLDCEFEVALADYDIEIPKIMFSKIAERVKVTARYEYAPKS
jgi:polyisoprenoid-binding protein YceI